MCYHGNEETLTFLGFLQVTTMNVEEDFVSSRSRFSGFTLLMSTRLDRVGMVDNLKPFLALYEQDRGVLPQEMLASMEKHLFLQHILRCLCTNLSRVFTSYNLELRRRILSSLASVPLVLSSS